MARGLGASELADHVCLNMLRSRALKDIPAEAPARPNE